MWLSLLSLVLGKKSDGDWVRRRRAYDAPVKHQGISSPPLSLLRCCSVDVVLAYQQLRERDLRRAKAAEQDAKNRADAEKKDGKDERMEELLRKVWREFTGHAERRGKGAFF